MKVLIVEDEIRIREGIEKLLSKLNDEFEIAGEAENGETGLRLLQELKADIVITDIKMPGMDGLEMLTRMTEQQINAKAIVLSAYSEFEYARQAMKLGVTEYLLKPIAYNEFAQALENVKLQVEKDRQEKPSQIGTIEQIFQFLISDRIEIDAEILEYLKNNYQIQEQQSFVIICVYLGSNYETVWERVKQYFQHALSRYAGLSWCITESAYRNSLIIVLYHYENAHDLERWMQYQILNHSEDRMSVGWIEVSGIGNLKEGFNRLYPYMDWNISLDNEVMISYPKITNIQTVSCIYPIELETRMKVAICAYDWDKVHGIMKEFHESFQDGKVYVPKEIKECYVRFLWAMIAMAKEIGCLDKKELEQQELLRMIMNARIREELISASDFLIHSIRPERTEADVIHLTVKRVKSMIHEFYQSGITLEEIGSKLNITPEYLGTLFHREMGVTFSTYMKNYRIGKAKELLCGTQMKLYEIAERVGYSDPKYFSKVFKEVTGQLPTEYRKTYK